MTGQTLATPWCKGGWPRSHDHANLGGLGGLVPLSSVVTVVFHRPIRGHALEKKR